MNKLIYITILINLFFTLTLPAQCDLTTGFDIDTLFVNSSNVINYKVNIKGGTMPFTYLWSPTSGVTCYTCEVPNSTLNSKFQTIKVVVTDAKGCTSSANQYVHCSNCEPCGLTASLDTARIDINQDDVPPTVVLKYVGNEGAVDVSWLPSGSVSCPGCLKTTLIADETTEYLAKIVDRRGCKSSALITLNVKSRPYCEAKVFVPNIFSPNHDGINDYFTLFSNNCVKKIIRMSIFDRWGNHLFDKSDFLPNDEADGWDFPNAHNGLFIYYIEYQTINKQIFSIRGGLSVLGN